VKPDEYKPYDSAGNKYGEFTKTLNLMDETENPDHVTIGADSVFGRLLLRQEQNILAIISHHFALPIEDLKAAVRDGIPDNNKGEK